MAEVIHVITQAPMTVEVATAGLRGPAGPAGSGGVHVFTQAAPAAAWHIIHPLSTPPVVLVIGSDGDMVEADVGYPSSSSVTLTFSQPISGNAYLYT